MKQFRTHAETMAQKAGQRLLEAFRHEDPKDRGTSKEIKSVFDEVADDIVKDSLATNFPDHSYLTEETGFVDNNSSYCWIIDPLDGTGNHKNHNPFFSVSISLWEHGEPLIGVIEAPALQERYIAVRGHGAYVHDLRANTQWQVQISTVTHLANAYLVFCEGSETDKQRMTELVSQTYYQSKDLRKLGSAALELAWIGTGRAEGYFAPKISIWDIAAGLLFVHEASGSVMDFAGNAISWQTIFAQEQHDLITTNSYIQLTLA